MWQTKSVKDIKPFVPGVPYFVSNVSKEEENEENEISKSQQNKRGGIIAYTDNGDLFVVLQNVMSWSFPKGHFEIEKDRSILDTAIREFREETKYPGYIDPTRLTNKMVIAKKHVFYLFKMTPEEVDMLPIINRHNDHYNNYNSDDKDEVIESRWVNLSDFDTFRRKNQVNKTLSEFNIPRFLKLADLPTSSSFGKRKSVKRKSNTKKRKSVKRKSSSKRKSGVKKKKSIKRVNKKN